MMRKLSNDELGRISVDEYRESGKSPIVIILDDIRSLANIGSVFRTADAFRLEKIYLCGITACPPHRDIHKTALGATESVEWEYVEDVSELIKQLQDEGHIVAAVEQVENSISLPEYSPAQDKKLALIFGHEVKGVSEKAVNEANICLEIPQFGTKHSLNISVSVGIVVWDIFSKIKPRFS